MWREPLRRHTRELMDEFIDRADELIRIQEHVQGLLWAVMSLVEDLSLPTVLERVVQSACDLVGAQYGALGVVDDGRSRLSHFVTAGMDEETACLIAELPAGQGLLGDLSRQPEPLRLHDLWEHPLASGFPEGHPELTSFLGVPVRSRGSVLGTLYLTGKAGGEDFTAEDEALTVALAAAAGVAIENARLFEDAERRRRWLEAGMEVSSRLIELNRPEDPGNLVMVAERALEVSESALAVIAVPGAAGGFRAEISVGALSLPAGTSLPASGLLSGVLRTGEPATAQANEVLGPDAQEKLGPGLVTALGEKCTSNGVLILARQAGSPAYSRQDEESSVVYSSRIGLALDLLRANREREEHLLLDDRDRIARDLHDLVIQRLFAAGMSIQSLRRFTPDATALERIDTVTGELDETIRELRNTIYSLRAEQGKESVTALVLRTVQQAVAGSGLSPHIRFNGPVDATVTGGLADQMFAVLTEAVSNTVRHSSAHSLQVAVTVADGNLELTIEDDGRGFERPARVSGLDNMNHRAQSLGGSCSIESAPGSGTRIVWAAPLA